MTADEREHFDEAWDRLSKKGLSPADKRAILRAKAKQQGAPPSDEVDEFVRKKLTPEELLVLRYGHAR